MVDESVNQSVAVSQLSICVWRLGSQMKTLKWDDESKELKPAVLWSCSYSHSSVKNAMCLWMFSLNSFCKTVWLTTNFSPAQIFLVFECVVALCVECIQKIILPETKPHISPYWFATLVCNITPLIFGFCSVYDNRPHLNIAFPWCVTLCVWLWAFLFLFQVREKVARAPSSSRWGSSMEPGTQTKIREVSSGLSTKTSSPPCSPWSAPQRPSRSLTNLNRIG